MVYFISWSKLKDCYFTGVSDSYSGESPIAMGGGLTFLYIKRNTILMDRALHAVEMQRVSNVFGKCPSSAPRYHGILPACGTD